MMGNLPLRHGRGSQCRERDVGCVMCVALADGEGTRWWRYDRQVVQVVQAAAASNLRMAQKGK